MPEQVEALDIDPVPKITTYFWLSAPIVGRLPYLPATSRALLHDALDLTHFHICKTRAFHLHPDQDSCECRFCHQSASPYMSSA